MTAGADESRPAAMRAALAATKNLKGHPESEVREALQAELAARGVTDVAPATLDPLVDAVLRGPRRAFLSATWSGLVAARGILRERRHDSPLPSWTASPRGVRTLEWSDNRAAVHAIVELAPDADAVVARIFDEVPEILDREDHGRRIFPCWLDVGPSDDTAGTLTVHVGEHVLGRLRVADSMVVREILATNDYTAVELNAVAVEGDPRVIVVGIPDRV